MQQKKNICKTLAFLIGLIVVLGIATNILQPKWTSWNNYDTVNGFYEQPNNTIETIFLGTSVMINAITPMELYEESGICAYNLATEQQPMFGSYYWLIEAFQYHQDTLQTVVLDVSGLRIISSDAYYIKAITGMSFSDNKLSAIKDIAETLDTFCTYASPLFSYHTRWDSLSQTDFIIFKDSINTSVRGYNLVYNNMLANYTYDEVSTPRYNVLNSQNTATFKPESLLYLSKMITFCEDNDLELILMKTPTSNWSDANHVATQKIADEYELQFLDFNYAPYLLELEYSALLDTKDGVHMNYDGATKLTEWFAQYLVDECDASDVRENPKYDFMVGELSDYKRNIISVILNEIEEPEVYIDTLKALGDYTILISARDEASSALSEEQRIYFENIGLIELAGLEIRESYLAVIQDGVVVYENSDLGLDKAIVDSVSQDVSQEASIIESNDFDVIESNLDAQFLMESEIIETTTEENYLYIEYENILPDGTEYYIASGGYTLGNISSCLIAQKEYSLNQRGLNIVVYDNLAGEVVDCVTFDTYAESNRNADSLKEALSKALQEGATINELTDDMRTLYLYTSRCEDAYIMSVLNTEIDETGLFQYLDAFWGEEQYMIILSVADDAANALDEASREVLEEMGLSELSTIEINDSYVALIDGGNILLEKKSDSTAPITESLLGIEVISGGYEAGNISSIIIEDTEYSQNKRGINVVIYNKETELLVDARTFDTCEYQQIVE